MSNSFRSFAARSLVFFLLRKGRARFHVLALEEDALRDGEVRLGVELLMDHRNARGDGFRRAADGVGLAFKGNLALVRLLKADDDLHQRGLARAVFTQQRVHLAGLYLKLHAVQRVRTAKGLGKVLAFENVFVFAGFLLHGAFQGESPPAILTNPLKALIVPGNSCARVSSKRTPVEETIPSEPPGNLSADFKRALFFSFALKSRPADFQRRYRMKAVSIPAVNVSPRPIVYFGCSMYRVGTSLRRSAGGVRPFQRRRHA